MKDTVTVYLSDPAPGLVKLLASLEPSDLKAVDAHMAELKNLRNWLSLRFGPPAAAPAAPANPALVAWREAVGAAIAKQTETLGLLGAELSKVSAAVEAQKELTLALADRVRVQSDLLGRRAELPPAPETAREPKGGYAAAVEAIKGWDRRSVERSEKVAVFDDPEAGLSAPEPLPDPSALHPTVPAADATRVEEVAPAAEIPPPEPVPESARVEERPLVGRGIHGSDAAGKPARGRANREVVLKVLAEGPLRFGDIVARSGVPRGSMVEVLNSGVAGGVWQKVRPLESTSPYELTDAGRRALADEGYVVPVPETKSAEPEMIALKTETKPAQSETADPCPMIARALARFAMMPHEVALNTRLDLEVVDRCLKAHSAARAPSAPGPRYWVPNPSGTWKLTNAGFDLAREGAAG